MTTRASTPYRYADFADNSALERAFHTAVTTLEPRYSPTLLARWAREAAAHAGQDPAAQAALQELLHAAPEAASALTPRTFLGWTRLGLQWLREDPRAAAAYFRASPEVLPRMGPQRLRPWVALARSLHWQKAEREELAADFFDASPHLFAAASFSDVQRLAELLYRLGTRSFDAAQKVLHTAAKAFPALERGQRRRSLTICTRIINTDLATAAYYMEIVWGVLAQVEPGAQAIFLDTLAGLATPSPKLKQLKFSDFLSDTGVALRDTTAPRQLGLLIILASRIALRSPAAACELLRSGKTLAQYLTAEQLEAWCRRGEELLRTHEAAGVSFFRLQSRQGQEALASYSSVVSLSEVREVLRLYCKALMGKNIGVLAAEDLQPQAGGWVSKEQIDWGEGPAIFAPFLMGEFPTKETNFEAYKVLATHQAAHLEFNTYDFLFEQEGNLFRSLRPKLAPPSQEMPPFIAGYDRFFSLFADRRLAQDLFTVAEDERVDALVREEYRGIRSAYRRIQQHTLEGRPDMSKLRLREYLVELLVRLSLQAPGPFMVPSRYVAQWSTAASIVRLMAHPGAIPEDVAEAVIRLYILLRQVPNIPQESLPPDGWVAIDPPDQPYDPATEDLERLLRSFKRVNRRDPAIPKDLKEKAQEQPYSSMTPAQHRRDFSPEVMQALLLRQRLQGELSATDPNFSEFSMEEFLRQWMEGGDSMEMWGESESEGVDPRYLLSSYFRSRPDTEAREKVSPLVDSVADPDVQVFQYDEWDYRSKSYRPGWCRLHQRALKEGAEEFYDEILHQHPALVHAIRKQFEMLRPEGIGKVKRLQDGEEFDLDAVVEAVVDKRAGDGLKDKIYWRRRKSERSVAVAVLLDMSLSTDERIDARTPATSASDGDDSADGTSGRRPSKAISGKRINEIEKESLVLLIEALEKIGDAYGIYGFSGSGRADVQFYMLKDMKEPFSARTKARIDNVIPLQGTRMGPAIRHTISKLAQEEARTKLLILVSDGRPQDRDYGTLPWELEGPHKGQYQAAESVLSLLGPDGVMTDEKEYAVHDTKAALNEAKLKHIIPFCISIDKDGHDYLKAMCGDIGYEIVSDIESLPRRLPSLYRRLTT